jgi:hypothetical protein
VVARTGDARDLNQTLLAQVSQVAGSWIERPLAVVSQIPTGDDSKRADSCERSGFRAAQGVLAITVADDLALSSMRQIQMPREGLTRVAVALGPTRIFPRIVSVRVRSRLSRTMARTATKFARFVAARRSLGLPRIVPISIAVRTASTPAARVWAETLIVA